MKHKRPIYFALAFCLALTSVAQLTWAMGRIPKDQYQAKVSELEQISKDLNQANSKISTLESQNAQLLEDMESGRSKLQKSIAKLRREKQEVENQKAEEVKNLKSTYDSLMSDMKKEIDQGSIQITQLQNKLSVNLIDKVLFNSGESEVNKSGRKVLNKVANILKKIQDKQIRIEGHTDNIPIGGVLRDIYPTNWELSTARATTVARFLQESGGMDPKVLSAAGYAHYRPIADNSTAKGRSMNRRIEISLVPMETSSATPPPAPPKKP